MSIALFCKNIEYAAQDSGYSCHFTLLASSNQDENMMEVHLIKSSRLSIDIQKIKQRRTVRSKFLDVVLKEDDLNYLTRNETEFIHYIPNTSKEHLWLNEQTIVANKIQTNRADAQKELSEWIRFSSKDAQTHADGLTVASMEIKGITAWYWKFLQKSDVMKESLKKSVNESKNKWPFTGWLLITSKDDTVASLLETGKRLQRLLLKIKKEILPFTR
ncbi:MAG: hypothetical protein IPN72_24310 [Saprospiraceae bacterium]|nr:hypothetical protein [Saprospiraceae bacterium]